MLFTCSKGLIIFIDWIEGTFCNLGWRKTPSLKEIAIGFEESKVKFFWVMRKNESAFGGWGEGFEKSER
jgi:hypothetical protein